MRARRNQDLLACCSPILMIGPNELHAGQLTLRPGRGLQADRIHTADLGQTALKLGEQHQRPLGLIVRGQRMELRQTRQASHILIHHGVVLHRARSQGIEGRCCAHIPLGQTREMAHDFAFADLGKIIERLPTQLVRQITSLIPLGNIVPWERVADPANRSPR